MADRDRETGDIIPLDGVVVAGGSSVDQAAITGESVPVAKGAGDDVYAGTQCIEGYLEVRVTKPVKESTIARVAALVEEAQAHPSTMETFIERFSRYYTPGVILAATLLMIVPPVAFGVPFLEAIYRALVLLVIACPCALAISTPVSMVSGITTAAHNGVLIKGRDALEAVGRARVMVFDKTGTLTTGRLEVEDVIGLGVPEADVLAIAASLESDPATRSRRRSGGVPGGVYRSGWSRSSSRPRGGVLGRIGGSVYTVGNSAPSSGEWRSVYERLEAEGKTVVLAGQSQGLSGL